jgi:hypothetical protein
VQQLSLSLEPGLAQKYRDMRECFASCVYQRGLGRVAAACDVQPSNLSSMAAEWITGSGARGKQQDRAAAAVHEFPGKTSFELADLITGDRETRDWVRFMLAKRLPECVGRVRKGAARACRITGRQAMTWWPA